jgi:hypothetical protein
MSDFFIKMVNGYIKSIDKVNNAIKEKYNIDVIQKIGESTIEEEEWQKEHPLANVTKQLTKGTVKGIFGPLGSGAFFLIEQGIKKINQKK